MDKTYVYFISYIANSKEKFGFNAGMVTVERTCKISTYEDLKGIIEAMKEKNQDITDVTILNYKLMNDEEDDKKEESE